MMQTELDMTRRASVPLVDGNMATIDSIFPLRAAQADVNLDEWALPVPMPGLDGGKAHTITTGTPGNSCTSYEAAERAHEGGESRSSMSLVNPLSSLESVHTGQTLGGGGKMRGLPVMGEEEELPTPMSPMSPGGSMSADDSRLRRSSRNHSSDGKPKEKRKVGRPIAYCGDPNSPDLTPAERRRILRRIANRESARRVRARRQELLEEMAGRAQEIEDSNARLMARAQSVEHKHQAMLHQVGALKEDLTRKNQENEQLLQEVSILRKSLSGGSSLQSIDRSIFRGMAAEQPAPSSPFSSVSSAYGGDMPFASAFNAGHLHSTSAADMSGSELFYGAHQQRGYAAAPGVGDGMALRGDSLLPPILEPTERSFSEFLKDVTAVGGPCC